MKYVHESLPESPLIWIYEEIHYAEQYTQTGTRPFSIDDYFNMLKVVRWYRSHRRLDV